MSFRSRSLRNSLRSLGRFNKVGLMCLAFRRQDRFNKTLGWHRKPRIQRTANQNKFTAEHTAQHLRAATELYAGFCLLPLSQKGRGGARSELVTGFLFQDPAHVRHSEA